MLKSLMFFILLFSCPLYAGYKTKEFIDGNNSTSMVYMCVAVGEKQGYANDSLIVLSKFIKKYGFSIKKSGELLNDAYTWYENRKDVMDFDGFWRDQCETPFDNLRKITLERH